MREEQQTVEASIQYTVACLIQCLGILRRKRQVSIFMYMHKKKLSQLLFKPFSISRPLLACPSGDTYHTPHDFSYRLENSCFDEALIINHEDVIICLSN